MSSLVPPSPIPSNSDLDCYTSGVKAKSRAGKRGKTKATKTTVLSSHQLKSDGKPGRKRAKQVDFQEEENSQQNAGADIVMLPPTVE